MSDSYSYANIEGYYVLVMGYEMIGIASLNCYYDDDDISQVHLKIHQLNDLEQSLKYAINDLKSGFDSTTQMSTLILKMEILIYEIHEIITSMIIELAFDIETWCALMHDLFKHISCVIRHAKNKIQLFTEKQIKISFDKIKKDEEIKHAKRVATQEQEEDTLKESKHNRGIPPDDRRERLRIKGEMITASKNQSRKEWVIKQIGL